MMTSPKPSHGQPRTTTHIVHSGEAQMDPTSAILLHPEELWSKNQLRKFTLLVSGLRLDTLHPSSQKQWTGEDVHALYPEVGQGRQERFR